MEAEYSDEKQKQKQKALEDSSQEDCKPTIEFIMLAKHKESSFHAIYSKEMPQIDNLKIVQISDRLKQTGFIYKNTFTADFKSTISQISDNSITYFIEFGYYTHYLIAYISNLQIPFLQRRYIASGKYGKTELFYYQGRKVIAKKINLDIEQGNILEKGILKEVFLLKFASAIGIGPKFIDIYCYDLIVLKNSVQFLMQYCDIKQIQSEVDIKDLKRKMRIMHSFNFVHGDMKPSNIGWSESNERFVFLDFGISNFIKEQFGHKTLSQFKGTYNYCYKQMKDAFKLKKQLMIDLYYNDLYGLNKSIQEKDEIPELFISKEMQVGAGWEIMVNFFKLNYYIYKKQLKKVVDLFQFQTHFSKTFQALIRQMENFHKMVDFEQQILKIRNQKKLSKIDASEQDGYDGLLFCQILKTKSVVQMNFLKLSFDNVEQLIKLSKMQKFWAQVRYKKQIFDLLYLNNKEFSRNTQIDHRQEFIIRLKNDLISQIIGSQNIYCKDKFTAYVEVLKIFREDFYTAEQIGYLQHIDVIFLLLSMDEQALKTRQLICQLFRKRNKDQECFSAISSFLLQKCSIRNPELMWQSMFVRKYEKQVKENQELVKVLVYLVNLDYMHNLLNETEELLNVVDNFKAIAEKSPNLNFQQNLREIKNIQSILKREKPYQPNCLLRTLKIYYEFCGQNESESSIIQIFQAKRASCPIYSQIQTLSQIQFLLPSQVQNILTFYIHYFQTSNCLLNFYPIMTCFKLMLKTDQISDHLEKFSNLLDTISIQTFLANDHRQISLHYIEKCIIHILIMHRLSYQKEAGEETKQRLNRKKNVQILISIKEKLSQKILSIENFFSKSPEKTNSSIDYLTKYSNLIFQIEKSDIDTSIKKIGQLSFTQFQQQLSLPVYFIHITHTLCFMLWMKFYEKKLMEHQRMPVLKKQIKALFFKLYNIFEKHNSLQKFPITLVFEIFYQNGEDDDIFIDLILRIGANLREQKVLKSNIAYHIVQKVILYFGDQQKYYNLISTWKLSDVAYDPYRVAIVAIICARKMRENLKDFFLQKNQRLIKINMFAQRTVQLCYHFNKIYQNHLWFQALISVLKKSERTQRIIRRQYIRSLYKFSDEETGKKMKLFKVQNIALDFRKEMHLRKNLMYSRMKRNKKEILKIFNMKIKVFKKNISQ